MKVYVVATPDYPSGGRCVFRTAEDAAREVQEILTDGHDGLAPITVSVEEMSADAFAALPEFES